MKDLDKLDEIYKNRDAKGHAHLSHRMGLLDVYDEGWSDGLGRAFAEIDQAWRLPNATERDRVINAILARHARSSGSSSTGENDGA